MSRHVDAVVNVYERLGRQRKVTRLVGLCPPGATVAANERAAGLMAAWTQADRDFFAAQAAVTSPSEKTWAAFLDAVRTRAVAPFSRVTVEARDPANEIT